MTKVPLDASTGFWSQAGVRKGLGLFVIGEIRNRLRKLAANKGNIFHVEFERPPFRFLTNRTLNQKQKRLLLR